MYEGFTKIARFSLNDVLMISGYFIVPMLMQFIARISEGSIIVHYYLGILSMFLFPLACVAMVQMAATYQGIREGLEFLQGFLWRIYSWPAGVLFYISLLFHGCLMWFGIMWGQFVFGDNFFDIIFPGKNYDIWSDPLFLIALCFEYCVSLWLVKRMWRWSFREFLPEDKLGWILFVVLGFPLYCLVFIPLIVILPPYLFFVVWGYMLVCASWKEKPIMVPLPDNPTTRVFAYAITWLYAVFLGYFFHTSIDIAAKGAVGLAAGEKWFYVSILLVMFYMPYRMFFALSNRKNIFGWALFALGICLVCFDMYKKFNL